MEYEIMSRLEAQEASRKKNALDTAIISITDYRSPPNKFFKSSWIKGILEMQFDDVTAGQSQCIQPYEAVQIAEFVLKMKDTVKRFIIHCEFGVSRSSGVAAAIMKHLDGDDSAVWDCNRFAPNPTCYQYVLSALKKVASRNKPFLGRLLRTHRGGTTWN